MLIKRFYFLSWFLAIIFTTMLPVFTAYGESGHGIAMHGKPKHLEKFTHFSYTNPDAPKGGRLRIAVRGSFDSLNPLIIKGISAAGIRNNVYESLMARAYDEAFSLYGLIAETIETPTDRHSVTFQIHNEAKFSDGHPITVEDVIFSHDLLKRKGRPNHRFYYNKVIKIEKVAPNGIKFIFNIKGDGKKPDREMPLIMGLMPILPKHAIDPDKFENTSLTSPIGSGPYLVDKVEAGKTIIYKRNPNYWGRHLNVNKGRFNFDQLQFDYYRDTNTLFEAFKKGLNHIRYEGDPAKWALSYDFPAIKARKIVREELDISVPSGMSALVFNTRRALFRDQNVRRALIELFDFEWVNRNLYHGVYKRTQSYFDRSYLSSHGRAVDAIEAQILAPFKHKIKTEIWDGTFRFSRTNGTGQNRRQRRKALKILQLAGYHLKGGRLIHRTTGQAFKFEILSTSRDQERLLSNFIQQLRSIGIDVSIRQVDSTQYQTRKKTFDYDMIQNTWAASLSPGNEQSFRWSVNSADSEGSFNFAGVKDPAIDKLIEVMLEAKTSVEFIASVRALDRLLLSGDYAIPLFHLPKQWIAYWAFLKHPQKTSLYGAQMDCWWAQDNVQNK